ncbi:MAG: aspartate carbamoyltransferase regulatory subunit [Muribaculaceae bacterium]|nr:aspartate carbamoyltransferase regulatory subunit [Muribaculaceae bacterium]
MSATKTSLAVAALENGTVIDHIPSASLFKVVRLLGLEQMESGVTIGNNLPSSRLGHKGIIKLENIEFDTDTLNRIAIIAPTATVNVIRNYDVYRKGCVELPSLLKGIVRCPNPKCISNHEPMSTQFVVEPGEEVRLRCRYCNHSIKGEDATTV